MSPKNSRPKPPLLGVVRLEDRTLPASMITVAVGANGSGTLDGFLFDATPGTVASADGGGNPGTLSTGALAAVAAGTNINVAAQSGISINDLGGTLTLQTGLGGSVTFNSGNASLIFANTGNTLATSGASINLTAGANVTAGNLNSGGGDVALTAGTSFMGNVTTGTILTGGNGNITLRATNIAGGIITQIGSVVGQAVTISAPGTVRVDAVRGTSVAITSAGSFIASYAANAIQSSAQLTLTAATGIGVYTTAAAVQASNSTSGGISITQFANPAQALTTAGTGVRNQAPGGPVGLTNFGDVITVAAGSPVQSSNGQIGLSALDFNIAGTVNSGSARMTLANAGSGQPIDLGTNAAGKVGLTQAELNNLTAGVLQVGNIAAGNVLVSAPVSAPAGWSTLTLMSGGSITDAAAGSLTVPNLRIGFSGPVTLDSGNSVGVLSASTSAAVFFLNGNTPLIIGTVDGATGVTTSGADLTIAANALDVQQVVNVGTGTVTFEPSSVFTTNVSLGGADAAGTLGLTDTELGRVTAGVLRIGFSAAFGSIAISSPVTRHAGYSTLSLVGGGISQTAALSVANLAAQSAGVVTLTHVGNDMDTVAAQITGSGFGFSYFDSNSVTVGTVAGLAGITDNAGPVQLSAGGFILDGNGPGTNVGASALGVTSAAGIDLDTDVGTISAAVSGPGSITLTEAGTATVNGFNTASGTITLDGGVFDLGHDNAIAGGGTLILNGAILNLGTFTNHVTGLQLVSGIISGSGILLGDTVFDVRNGFVNGRLGGAAGLIKSTSGAVTLSAANAYTGATTVTGGTLLVDGSLTAGTAVMVNGGTLGGKGTVGSITAISGSVAPGNSPGLLTANGTVNFGPSAALVVELNGANATVGDYDRLIVTGTVNLGNAALNISVGGGFAPSAGTQFVIIDNDGTDAVTGTFAGLPEGATLTANGQSFTISYHGGTGNDVVLTRTATPPLAVSSVVINAGQANLVQRSLVTNVTVTFSRLVNFVGSPPAAFQLTRTGPGSTGNVTIAVDSSGSTATQTVARLTFSGPLSEGANSLVDGNYTLTVFNDQIQGGIQGGDNLTNLFRLYGDVNGDKAVNGTDLTAFRNAFGTVSTDASYVSFLDFNGDGAINGTDLTQFRSRFGVILP